MTLTERSRELIPESRYRKKRSVMRNQDDVGGRARVTSVIWFCWTRYRPLVVFETLDILKADLGD